MRTCVLSTRKARPAFLLARNSQFTSCPTQAEEQSPDGFFTSLLAIVPTLLIAMLPASICAQTSPAPAPTDAPREAEKVIEMSPYEVREDPDDSYGAINSNSLTGFNASLERLPISADVLTETFMKDTGSMQVEEMVGYFSAGAEAIGATGDADGGTNQQPLDAKNTMTLRGLSSTTMKQDGFLPPGRPFRGKTLSFNVERVDVIRGPQSLMYGNGSPGGVINVTSKQARFNRAPRFSLEFEVDTEGAQMAMADVSVSRGKFALRAASVYQKLEGYRLFIGGTAKGNYVQLAYRPFENTTIRLTNTFTVSDRMFDAGNLRLAAGSTALDGRHNLMLTYILASNQVEKSATGASGAGPIDNGYLSWETAYSYLADWRSEWVKIRHNTIDVETKWASWLDTKISAGDSSETFNRYGTTARTFHSPISPTNPFPGHWTLTHSPTAIPQSLYQRAPTRVRGLRFTAVITNKDLFGHHIQSQTLIGGDYIKTSSDIISGSYFLADANFNPIINPAQMNNGFGGRTLIAPFSWTIDNGPYRYPAFTPGAERVTFNGQNYLRMDQNPSDPAKVSASNPLGVTLGGASNSLTDTKETGVYAVNITDWMEGKLNTLAGVRYGGIDQLTLNQSGPAQSRIAPDAISYNLGASYRLLNWLIPYVGFSSGNGIGLGRSTDSSGLTQTDPLGTPASKVSESIGKEAGFKFASPRNAISGSIAVYEVLFHDDLFAVNGNLATAINPSGLNGDYKDRGTNVVVDRRSAGVEAVVTANPVRNWRMRISAAAVKGRVNTATSYDQVYNDQFYQNAAGQVTYQDGTLVYVNPTYSATAPIPTASTPGAFPLTIAMMSTPGNAYYANPNTTNGQIASNSSAAAVLRRVDAVHGPVLTGATGLPISAIQINPGFTLPGTIETTRVGDNQPGYPELSLNMTNSYEFTNGWLKGLTVGGSVILAWRRNMYNYFVATPAPGVDRVMFRRPNTYRFDPMVRYEKRFGKVNASFQINVINLFDRWHPLILPSTTTGYTSLPNLAGTIDEEMRKVEFFTRFEF